MVTDEMVEKARSAVVLGEDADGKPVYLSAEEARAALEAALSAAKSFVAMKALDDNTMQKLREALRFSASRSVMSSADEQRILSVLSAQVQDESEIVDCLLEGKPFVFDPATSFCHADDGGAPEHGIKYVPAAQVQDVAGWQPIETAPKDGKHCLLAVKSGPFVYAVQGAYSVGKWENAAGIHSEPLCWMPLTRIPPVYLSWTDEFAAAAPAKQEG